MKILVTPKSRVCTACKIEKPIDEFHFAPKGTHGRQSKCKPCRAIVAANWHKNRSQERRVLDNKRTKQWRIDNPIKARNSELLHAYGINWLEFLDMLKAHNWKCAICKTPVNVERGKGKKYNRAHVDHCHATGKIRGILCTCCNSGIGMFKDSKKNLLRAVGYLEGQVVYDADFEEEKN